VDEVEEEIGKDINVNEKWLINEDEGRVEYTVENVKSSKLISILEILKAEKKITEYSVEKKSLETALRYFVWKAQEASYVDKAPL
jgi:hypothetical protein